MAGKPKNEFAEEQEKRKKAQQKYYRMLREKQVRKRLGLTRHNQQINIRGMNMLFTATPVIVRERWIRCSAIYDEYGDRIKKGRTYHIAVWRYSLCSADGRTWTALQAQCHDGHHGWMLNVTGFWNLKLQEV